MTEASIFIPVQNSQERVQVSLENLPNHNDLLDLLKAEQAPLDIWLSLAREYFKKGNVDAFLEILEEGSCPEVDEFYSEVKFERIAILNAMAAFYTNKAKTAKRQRDENFIKAVDFYNKAARIDSQELTTWVGKGQLQLAKGDWDNAAHMFSIVLQEKPNYSLALLGQACALFNKGKFQDALSSYKKVLQVNPTCPPFVRLGIGLCHYRLQFLSPSQAEFHSLKARLAFERVLQLEPDNVEGLVYLAMLDINSDNEASLKEAFNRLKTAFEIYPYNPLALSQLANHFFFSEEKHLVEPLVEAAASCTSNPALLAESYFSLGRVFHSKGDWDKALLFYHRSTQELLPNSDFVLPWFGLAQVHFKRREYEKAVSCLQKVLEVHPNNPESVKLLGIVQKKQGLRKEALASFKKATSLDPSDEQAWMECSELSVAFDLSGALEALKKAQSLLQLKDKAVPEELLNNLGVLYFLKREYPEAEATYLEALGSGPWSTVVNGQVDPLGPLGGQEEEASEKVPEDEKVPLGKVALVFNLARLFEQLRESGKAVWLYRLIVKSHPAYVDAYLRLAVVAQSRFDWERSLDWISKTLTLDPSNVDALLLRSAAEVKQGLTAQAKDTLKRCLEASGANPPAVANLALGNWNLNMSSRPHKDPTLEGIFLDKAREYYVKALSQNSSNLFAASGIACVLAEKGQFDSAKEVFMQVQEACASNWSTNVPEVWMNLAHVHLAKSEFNMAIKMYQNCLKKLHYGEGGEVMLYLARAQYEAEQYENATRTLFKALHLFPANHTLRFNAGLVLQKYATVAPGSPVLTVEQATAAMTSVKAAIRIFKELVAMGSKSSHGFDQKRSKVHLDFCTGLLESAGEKLGVAEQEEQKQKEKEEVVKQRILEEGAKKKAEQQKLLEEVRRKKDEADRLAAELEAEFQQRKASWRRESTEADGEVRRKGEKKRKRNKKGSVEEDKFIVDDEEEENQEAEARESPVREAEEGGESEDGNLGDKMDARNRNKQANVTDLEDGEMGGGDGNEGQGRRKKVRAIVESGDEEGELHNEERQTTENALKRTGLDDSDSD